MLYVGSNGPYVGNAIEIGQSVKGFKSAGDFQDAYSNFLGYQFNYHYGNKLKSNPKMFTNY